MNFSINIKDIMDPQQNTLEVITIEENLNDWLIKNLNAITSEDIDLQNNFEDYGIDSVTAIRLLAKISDFVGYEISPSLLHRFDNFAALNKHLAEECYQFLKESSQNKKRVVISASFTSEPIAESMLFWAKKLDFSMNLTFSPYNQIFQELLNEQSELRTNDDTNVLLIRTEDWFRYTREKIDRKSLLDTIHSLMNILAQVVSTSSSKWILCLCPHSKSLILDEADIAAGDDVILQLASTIPNLYVLDARKPSKTITHANIFDITRDSVGHIPFTQEYFASLGLQILRIILGTSVPPAKVIVLDCDNTLWQGVCAEDGIQGIKVTPEFMFLQNFMLEQQKKGKLLCLCSKNQEKDVLEVFQHNKEMLIKLEDITSHQINWQTKSSNIEKIATELQLGLDSVIFIDDNPVECAEVRSNLPQVTVIELPDLQKMPNFLNNHWSFDVYRVTEEDMHRSKMYQQNQKRNELRGNVSDFQQFLQELQLTVTINPIDDNTISRTSQITERTNQFNATTIRRTENEIQQFLANPCNYGYTVKVQDRFGDYGVVGLLLLTQQHNQIFVDSFMLSCRVLGRKVEHQMIQWIANKAKEKDCLDIVLQYKPTNRNQPLANFYTSLGYPLDLPDDISESYHIAVNEVDALLSMACTEYAVSTKKKETQTNRDVNINENTIFASETLQFLANLDSAEQILECVRQVKKIRPSLSSQYVSPRTSWQTKIAALWSDILGIENIGIHDDFYELGGDSLRAAEFAAYVAQLKVPEHISLTTIQPPTIAELARQIENAQNGNTEMQTSEWMQSLEKEAVLDRTFTRTTQTLPTLTDSNMIFLTGGSGYFGAFLISEIMTNSKANILCHVRAKNEIDGFTKIKKNLGKYQLWEEKFAKRLQIVLGDLAQPSLGMSDTDITQIQNQADMIIHNGAWVNFVLPYEKLKASNVNSIYSIIDLVTNGKEKPLHFVSTLGVLMSGGYGRNRKLYEDQDLDHSEDLPNGYEQTKWVADKIVWKAIQQGLPASIYRLGMLSGLSSNGTYHKLDEFLSSFFKGCVQLGSFPQLDTKIEMVPIDFIVQSMTHILKQPQSLGKVYQMNHTKALFDKEFCDWITNFGYPLRYVSWELWKKQLLSQPTKLLREQALYPYLEFLRALQYHQVYMPEMDMGNFLGAIEKTDLNCASHPDLLQKYFEYFVNVGYLPKPNGFHIS